ncbi:hypothetical protein FDP41_012451 [Naegleria fowleri]|uniref:Uncharacterized protein n=1 Tax=Naegleria fowleri TaxID=5763 RepID=A0A6A5C5P6_NAEFO|nr:uncharacterized protein FDP41_012451 [Naegleria fowleri]KAF0981794.1 hypothetical protein FDP41_012451 [Naegleria fowleri]CAG4713964.1 unnamed protein product [Naegleria fowleri]
MSQPQATSVIPLAKQHSHFQLCPPLSIPSSHHGQDYSPQIDEEGPSLNNTTVAMTTSPTDTFQTSNIIQVSPTSENNNFSSLSLIQYTKSNLMNLKTLQRALILIICLCVLIISIAWNFIAGVLMSLKVILCIASGIVVFKKNSIFLVIVSILLMLELVLNIVASIFMVTLYAKTFLNIASHFREVLWSMVIVFGLIQMVIVVLNVTIARRFEKEENLQPIMEKEEV